MLRYPMVETNLTNQPGQPYDGPSVRQTCRNLIFNSTLVSTLKPTVYDGEVGHNRVVSIQDTDIEGSLVWLRGFINLYIVLHLLISIVGCVLHIFLALSKYADFVCARNCIEYMLVTRGCT